MRGREFEKKKVLFEGAHGTFLDGVFGTYPYTVAIHTMSGAIFPMLESRHNKFTLWEL